MTKAEKLRLILLSICATSLLVGGCGLIYSVVTLSKSRNSFASSQTELRAAQATLIEALRHRNEAIEGLSYACGYLAGQSAMIRIADLRVAIPPAVDGCDERKAVAARNGFDRP